MAESSTIVVVGGGLAGAKAAEALRDKGFDGQIVLFGEERHLPYERRRCRRSSWPARRR
ncbi:pyridine nucleotide-disulfide oxidoreductase family protein [Mycobacterium xenopi 4042]|uniref:Pyridine nucleotide-disulfide oxidoreductase family protein n=1 Tax=Mycobacterium xenopi 4042 TaxID=1299334 RepID=X8BHJ8_MYCXE|nr:pyridine nucleotide-disulfide oxidoreductase family protein [Mycobacterium xenopi 4042]